MRNAGLGIKLAPQKAGGVRGERKTAECSMSLWNHWNKQALKPCAGQLGPPEQKAIAGAALTTENDFSSALDAGSLRSEFWQSWLPDTSLLCLQTAAHWLPLHRAFVA